MTVYAYPGPAKRRTITVRASVAVARPADEVFALLTSPGGQFNLSPTVIERQWEPPGPMQVGTRINLRTLVRGVGPRSRGRLQERSAVYEVTGYAPEQREYRTRGLAGIDAGAETCWRVEPAGEGCILTVERTVEVRRLQTRLFAPLYRWLVRTWLRLMLRRVRRAVEAPRLAARPTRRMLARSCINRWARLWLAAGRRRRRT